MTTPNGATQSLDARIAAVLAADNPSKNDLITLVHECNTAIAKAEQTVEVESERALDLNNAEPDQSDELVRKAQRTVARLQNALPLLTQRLHVIDDAEYAQNWHSHMNVIEGRRDALAEELANLYPAFVQKLVELYATIDGCDSKIDQLHSNAPNNEVRRLVATELKARKIGGYSANVRPLRENLKLPIWDASSKVFPHDPMDEWNRLATESAARTTAIMASKFALSAGPDWFEAKKLADQETRAESARLQEMDDKARAEDTRRYNQALLKADRLPDPIPEGDKVK